MRARAIGHIALLLVGGSGACRRVAVDLADLPCDGARCLTGYICDPRDQTCKVRGTCADGTDHCADNVAAGSTCSPEDAVIPCSATVDDCSLGCRECLPDDTWSECWCLAGSCAEPDGPSSADGGDSAGDGGDPGVYDDGGDGGDPAVYDGGDGGDGGDPLVYGDGNGDTTDGGDPGSDGGDGSGGGDAEQGDPGGGDPGPGDPAPGDSGGDADDCPWWDTTYSYRLPLTVANSSAAQAPAGYTVTVTLDHESLVNAGKSRSDGRDLRIVSCTGIELDRVDASLYSTGSRPSSFNTSTTRLFFATDAAMAAGSGELTYMLYYGRAYPGAPPASPAAVFDFWEPFTDLSAWTVVGDPGGSTTSGILNVTSLQPGDLYYITGASGTRDANAGFAVRARAAQLNLDNDFGPVGWYFDFGTGERFDLSADLTRNRIRYWGTLGAVGSTLAVDTSSPAGSGTWYVYEATVAGQDFTYYRDGTYVTDATSTLLSSGKVHIDGECITARWDWLLIRHFVSPEPSVSLGVEQAL